MERKKAHFEGNEPILEKLLSYLRYRKIIKKVPKGSAVLDLGCGFNGSLIEEISENISRGVGVDISVNEKISNDKISLLEHNLNKRLPFENNSFDVAISLANLEHLKHPKQTIEDIFRVLKPGGTLLLTTPSTYSKPVLEFMSYRLGLISEEEIRDHKNYFNKKILLNYCRETGFEEVKHSYFQLFMNNFLIAKK